MYHLGIRLSTWIIIFCVKSMWMAMGLEAIETCLDRSLFLKGKKYVHYPEKSVPNSHSFQNHPKNVLKKCQSFPSFYPLSFSSKVIKRQMTFFLVFGSDLFKISNNKRDSVSQSENKRKRRT